MSANFSVHRGTGKRTSVIRRESPPPSIVFLHSHDEHFLQLLDLRVAYMIRTSFTKFEFISSLIQVAPEKRCQSRLEWKELQYHVIVAANTPL